MGELEGLVWKCFDSLQRLHLSDIKEGNFWVDRNAGPPNKKTITEAIKIVKQHL